MAANKGQTSATKIAVNVVDDSSGPILGEPKNARQGVLPPLQLEEQDACVGAVGPAGPRFRERHCLQSPLGLGGNGVASAAYPSSNVVIAVEGMMKP